MPNDMRDRLIELVEEWYVNPTTEYLVDHLIANGVILPPCKVGDAVWEIDADNPFDEELQVIESKVEMFYIGTSRNLHSIDCKTVFLTKEDAEKALSERSNDNG